RAALRRVLRAARPRRVRLTASVRLACHDCWPVAVAADSVDLPSGLPDDVVPVLGNGFVALDGALASDLAVVNGARVSFNQASDQMGERDEGLIRFLMRERHGSPFEHGYFRFVVKAPLFVVREHHRHRAGHSYNEWSGRYSKMEPEFYVPDFVRTQIGKPGAYSFEDVDEETRERTQREIAENAERAFQSYERMLEQGVAKEVARAVLPLSTYTKYYWSCNPRSLMHFC